jgi:hypothetical protein
MMLVFMDLATGYLLMEEVSEGVLKITSLKRCDPTVTHDVPLATAPCSPYYDALWPGTWEVYEAAHTRPPV